MVQKTILAHTPYYKAADWGFFGGYWRGYWRGFLQKNLWTLDKTDRQGHILGGLSVCPRFKQNIVLFLGVFGIKKPNIIHFRLPQKPFLVDILRHLQFIFLSEMVGQTDILPLYINLSVCLYVCPRVRLSVYLKKVQKIT